MGVLSSRESQNFQSSSEEVAIVIGYKSCVASPSYCQIDTLGSILYNGVYRPKIQSGSSQQYEDFSVQLPAETPKGAALLNVVHFALIGVRIEIHVFTMVAHGLSIFSGIAWTLDTDFESDGLGCMRRLPYDIGLLLYIPWILLLLILASVLDFHPKYYSFPAVKRFSFKNWKRS